MRPLLRLTAGTAAAGAATLAYAALVERNLFTLRRFEVPVLEPGSQPMRILHLSDAHFTPGQHHKRRWIAGLVATDPDLVVLTGDSLADVDAVGITLQAYGPLMERPGAFVLGSNDYYGPVFKNPFGYFGRRRSHVRGVTLPTGELRAALTGAGWADLSNASATLKIGDRLVELIGVDDPHIGLDDYQTAQKHQTTRKHQTTQPCDLQPCDLQPSDLQPSDLQLSAPQSSAASADAAATNGADLRIGLTHSPEPRLLDVMANDGYQLLLAGHTHGGQVCVPGYGALITNCGLSRRMAKGLHRWRGSTTYLHVSAGIGTHPTMPVRFACRPEASLLTLVPR